MQTAQKTIHLNTDIQNSSITTKRKSKNLFLNNTTKTKREKINKQSPVELFDESSASQAVISPSNLSSKHGMKTVKLRLKQHELSS